jgi:multicomponent Na+:H+ antiporter subunit C
MTATVLLYGLAGVLLVGMGLYRVVVSGDWLRRIVAVNVLTVGVASILVTAAYRGPDAVADPVPHAFVLTGIVVLVSTTAVALALIRIVHRLDRDAHDR